MQKLKQFRWFWLVILLCMTFGLAITPQIGLSQHTGPYFEVNSTLDEPDAYIGDGKCSSTPSRLCTLRAAVQEGQAVNLAVSVPEGLYELSLGHLDVSKNLTLTGAGSGKTKLDGMLKSRVFDIADTGFAYIGNVTVQWGKATVGFAGHYHGGGIHNHGTLILVDSTVRASSTDLKGWGGGGITNAGTGKATLVNVTIAGNSTSGGGGGIENLGTMDVYNSTIVSNQSFQSETSGGGIANTGKISLKNTLVANNFYGKNCNGTIIDLGFNLSSDDTCGFPEDRSNVDLVLGGRDDNDTYPIYAGSPAIDGGTNEQCQSTDQRGVTRPQDGNKDGTAVCDVGAYEFVPSP
ncbi:hypothetical protein G7B40_033180 [Aetokthonos hydrillicola Thurmond2011]|jgi:hypothetical protein|uniref:CSLREA domain-containing protein n=1 Tax=Aetokthonos hydrillicola Thurmond2011 TaxID=2712845 RepID=A0AAP5IFC7_9CYAN|nr:choice-of-anchor Q domain-containing protein [Aetokthonos hydrillicola]MBO3459586.1 hypothetical protein [Aetokthonos hydrillicola CCALA 1050]MBW4590951.1 hypothetical protein [Aetokthonos hydrillicola CCALA 1050]MDR9899379.1 hypothetical protein [Aetokthonos hydrillicola Thurmond2011]